MQKNKPIYILIHCSDISEKTHPDQFREIDIYHKQRGFPISFLGYYVGYHRLITGGKNYYCRHDEDEGAHCNQVVDGLSMNFQSLGVCWAGDGDTEMPSEIHYKLLQEQVWAWQDKYSIPNKNVRFHRDYATWKTCPGGLITRAWLETLLTRPKVIPQADLTCKKESDTIEAQKKQISVLENIIKTIINWFNKK